ncbi:MAG: sodium:calcium antiporter [Actinomycetota bacterium]
MDWILLAIALVIILGGAELFTNGIEWVGEGLGLSEGAVGSVLAAVGTALPETLLPLIAFVTGGSAAAVKDIGIGAILGAPLMLTTLAMFVLGVAVLVFSRGGRRSTDLDGDDAVILQDLGYFLAMYTLAFAAGLIHWRPLHWALAVFLLIGYGFYVRRHFASPSGDEAEMQGETEVHQLHVWRWLSRLKKGGLPAYTKDSPMLPSYVQVALALALIVGGAKMFIVGVDAIATQLNVSALVLGLLIAPIATELPEKFNSVLWVRRKKDTLALGNVTGALVFQSTFPVTLGLLLTSWRLEQEGLVAAVIALVAASTLWITMKIRGKFQAWLLLGQGVFYAGYVGYVVSRAN